MLLNPFCPCGHPVPYSDCCEPYLTGKAKAPTAEALMRSRYTAYSKGLAHIDYLIATWHPKAAKSRDRTGLPRSLQGTRWLGLTILKTQKGQPADKRGVVEFVARYQDTADQNPVPTVQQLRERSRFVQEQGQWFYVDGDRLPIDGDRRLIADRRSPSIGDFTDNA
jgi:SEC-C motif domain protein